MAERVGRDPSQETETQRSRTAIFRRVLDQLGDNFLFEEPHTLPTARSFTTRFPLADASIRYITHSGGFEDMWDLQPGRPMGESSPMLDESSLKAIENTVKAATDITLDCRRLLVELQVVMSSIPNMAVGAIHALKEGDLRLTHPIFYRRELVDDEVLLSIPEMGVYASGMTEESAITELKEQLDIMHDELATIPDEQLGAILQTAKRLLR